MSFEGFKQLFKRIDTFGVTIEFRINKKEKYNSFFGGLVTLIYSILGLAFFFVNFNHFYNRENMSLEFTEKVHNIAPHINFTNLTTGFAFGLIFENNTHIQSNSILNYFDISLSAVSLQNTLNKTKKSISLRNCQHNDFYNNQNETFESLNINEMLCPQDKEFITARGIFTDNLWQYVEFTVKIKNSKILNSEENIRNLFLNYPIKLLLYYTDTFMDANNFDNPINQYINSMYVYLDYDFYKKINLDFYTLQFSSDENMLLTNPIVKNLIMVGESRDYGYSIFNRYNSTSPDYTNLVRIYVRSSQKYKAIVRSYQKFYEFLSVSTVLISNGYLVIFVFMRFYNTFYAKNLIMSKIIKFKEHSYNEKVINQIKRLTMDISALDNPNRKESNIKDKIEKIELKKLNNEEAKTTNKANTQDNLLLVKHNLYPTDMINLNINRNPQIIEEEKKKNQNYSMSMLLNESFTDNKQIKDFFNTEKYETEKQKSNIIPVRSNMTISKDEILRIASNYTTKELLDFTFCEFLRRRFCCNDSKQIYKIALMKQGRKKINQDLDILNYLKKMQEIEYLKVLLLSADQIKLLNFISKPSISLVNFEDVFKNFKKLRTNTELNNSLDNSINDLHEEEVSNLFNCLRNLSIKTDKNEVDEKLIFLFKKEIRSLLKNKNNI